MAKGRIEIGTSGWHYDHWVGPFYPKDMKPDRMLRFYAERFPTVEINNSFYQLPDDRTLDAWVADTPARFIFAMKASRYITHMKKLKDPHQSTAKFFRCADHVGSKIGPILFQLPPHWHLDVERLRTFLKSLPGGHRYTFEFRHKSWFDRRVYDLLRGHNVALCAYDLNRRRSPVKVTSDFVYVRLHGPDGPYKGQYDGRTLNGWVRRLRNWSDEGIDAYCYFDNDEKGYAAADAARLIEMVER